MVRRIEPLDSPEEQMIEVLLGELVELRAENAELRRSSGSVIDLTARRKEKRRGT